MLTPLCQRWRARRASYRPAREPIDTRRFEVAPIERDVARGYVIANHYAASYPAGRLNFGLFQGSALVGVAVFSHPVNEATLKALPGEGLERIELGRFVLDNEVGGNGESWFLARCFEQLRSEGIVSVISFSDPEARCTAAGEPVFAGHIGGIYQASNAVYAGRARPDTQRLLPDGTVLHSRAIAKLRKRERGWTTAARLLESYGAEPLRVAEDAAAWAERWVPRLTRKRRHDGNHKYLFGLTRAAKRALPESLPYPKLAARLA
ncbi:MAG TPA: hypothetical protein VGI39_01380 [Polyangiaceae bacterium]|jgi:hypothetical protein